jgi:ABC-2 type transport system permease protein
MARTLPVTLGLAGRNLLLVRRMPSVFVPSLVMPLFILVATSGAFRGIGALGAFAGASYLAFTIPLAVTMGAGFAGINSGMTLARDLESGFFFRLQASPIPRVALVLGPLTAAMARSLLTTTLVLLAGLAGGVGPPGPTGTLVLYGVAMGFSACASCWAIGVALRSRTIQSAPLMQIVVFLSVFTSVAYVPRQALTGWLSVVSDWNPVTHVLEAERSVELTGVAWGDIWPGLLSLAGLLTLLGAFALSGLQGLNRR